MSIDVIFLGLDGVLFDTEALHLAACNAAFANAELSIRWTLPALRAAAATHGYARAIGSAVAVPPLSRDKHRVAQLFEDKHQQFHQAILTRPPQTQAAALALIEDATAAGCKVCILTDLPAPATSALLERYFGIDVNSIFSVVAGGASFDGPAGTGPYAHALHAMGVAPQDAIVIDTAVPALRAAADAGLWTVSVAPYGNDVVRPRQFITFDALHELQASPYTPDQQRPAPKQHRAA
ncbi:MULTISPECIES: HAD family hydrolase [unclassified Duganella]|jgi:beta-phosphoglucomutase-like phosphatase (HAD superfamily)|uniref:HAD family hydrolase n=1 Tax=unclassified Duganella TaxID=2636909 RepID=UPI0008867CE0|nr:MULTISPECIES: HAD family hydrolase [unclassified Duganella]SDH08195.1 Beta-phosphoglucomutase, HAD superfamily [Duganella sp. OV458]SDK18013.1 Beta-phosphoglucomutase, HAD superfamily [Duganella sp. OV510]